MAKLTLPSLKNVDGDKPSWFHRARIPAWLLVSAAICALLSPLKVPMTVHTEEFGKLNLMFVMDFSGSMEASDWPEDKPLQQEEIDKYIKKILGNLKFKLGAEIR